jgi:UMF1 family MFS transporter
MDHDGHAASSLRPASATWLTKPVFGWALYDVASSTYAAIVPTLFSVFFIGVVLEGAPRADATWGLLAALALLAAGLTAPVLGAVVDGKGRWMAPLAGLTAVCCIATISLSMAGTNSPPALALLFLLAQSAYFLACAVVDSVVIRIAHPDAMGRVSAFGWALGFLGGIGALLITLAVLDPEDGPRSLPRIFGITGALYAMVGIVSIAGLRLVPRGPAHDGTSRLVLAAHRQVMSTLREWRSHRNAFQMLVGFNLINVAGVALVSFAPIMVVETLGTSVRGLCWYILLYHLVALPSTLAAGFMSDRFGTFRAMMVVVVVWVLVVLGVANASGPMGPATVAALPALVFGGTQALSRAFLATRIPSGQAGEFFGFQAVLVRVSTAVGPLMVGILSSMTGSRRLALGALLVFVIGGALVLARALAAERRSG